MAGDDMDRDFAIRTMLGEAANQGDAGLAGVANVILNRAQDGGYGGKTATDVVLAPKQFEPWQTRSRELLAIPKDSPAYQRAGQIYDMVSSGEIPDITSGATHFLNKQTVMDRSGRLPDWAKGPGLDIGAHTFLKPNGAVNRQTSAPDLSGIDALDALAEPKTTAPASAAPRVRVTLPNADQSPAPAKPAEAAQPNGLDALEKIASASDTAKPAVEPGDGAAAVGAGIIKGIPVAGPYLMDKLQQGLANVRAYQSGKPYEQELDAVRRFTDATAEQNPTATTAGNVLGGVVGLAPVAATSVAGAPVGAALLGMRGPMVARIAAGMASGAGIGAADAQVRGEDAKQAAALGGFVGGVAPIAGRAIGAAVGPALNRLTNAATDTLSGPTRASNALLSALDASEQTIPGLQAELQRNPNLTIADLNPSVQSALGRLAQEGGPEAATLRRFVGERRAAAGDQVRESFADSIGAAPDPVALREQLTETARNNAQRAFRPILRGAQPVDLNGLSQSAQERIAQARERALAPFTEDARNGMNEAEQLHLTQQQLRREADTLAGSAAGTDRLAAGDVRHVRDQLISRIDAATQGRFRPAQRQFADDMEVRQAFDNGMSGLDRVRRGVNGLEDRPEALARDWHAMRPEEREAYREGMRTQIANIIENNRNPARAGEAVTDPGFNRQKLAIVFGDQQANRLMRAVEDSRAMAETNNLIHGGSATAPRTLGGRLVQVRGGAPADEAATAIAGAIGGPKAVAARLGLKGLNAAAMGRLTAADVERNRLITAAGTAAGPDAAETLNRLEQFMQARRAGPVAARRAVEQNAPLNLLIRAGGQRAYSP